MMVHRTIHCIAGRGYLNYFEASKIIDNQSISKASLLRNIHSVAASHALVVVSLISTIFILQFLLQSKK